ncbi:hypothetical protein cyc_07840 [Cyclospora cayetanensis]|uniref:Uncharacterized protein n=1 Tax=Cyclospora cayetanensis TaxID=88456 RepID=A0A1D3D616_9EIME|nr:hypothetical protein cyc_07840 [Cyclospora cayetanensis]
MPSGTNRLVVAYGTGKMGEWVPPSSGASMGQSDKFGEHEQRKPDNTLVALQTSELHEGALRIIEFNSTGDLCLTADDRGTVVLWSIRETQENSYCWRTKASVHLEEPPAMLAFCETILKRSSCYFAYLPTSRRLLLCDDQGVFSSRYRCGLDVRQLIVWPPGYSVYLITMGSQQEEGGRGPSFALQALEAVTSSEANVPKKTQQSTADQQELLEEHRVRHHGRLQEESQKHEIAELLFHEDGRLKASETFNAHVCCSARPARAAPGDCFQREPAAPSPDRDNKGAGGPLRKPELAMPPPRVQWAWALHGLLSWTCEDGAVRFFCTKSRKVLLLHLVAEFGPEMLNDAACSVAVATRTVCNCCLPCPSTAVVCTSTAEAELLIGCSSGRILRTEAGSGVVYRWSDIASGGTVVPCATLESHVPIKGLSLGLPLVVLWGSNYFEVFSISCGCHVSSPLPHLRQLVAAAISAAEQKALWAESGSSSCSTTEPPPLAATVLQALESRKGLWTTEELHVIDAQAKEVLARSPFGTPFPLSVDSGDGTAAGSNPTASVGANYHAAEQWWRSFTTTRLNAALEAAEAIYGTEETSSQSASLVGSGRLLGLIQLQPCVGEKGIHVLAAATRSELLIMTLQGKVTQHLLPLKTQDLTHGILPPDLQEAALTTANSIVNCTSKSSKEREKVQIEETGTQNADNIVGIYTRGQRLFCLLANWTLHLFELQSGRARHQRLVNVCSDMTDICSEHR